MFFGKLMTTLGQWMSNVTTAIVAFDLTGSASMVGLVSVAQFAPQLVLAPISGRLADQGDPVRQIIAGRLLILSSGVGTAMCIWLCGGVDKLPGAWVLLLAALVVGLGTVLGGPAMQSIVPTLVRPNEIAAAVTLNSTPMTIARAAGPAVAAALLVGIGPVAAFAAAASMNMVLVVVLMVVRVPRPPRATGTDYRATAGIRYVLRDRSLRLGMVCTAAAALVAEPALTLAPSIAARLDAGTQFVGLIASCFGIGCAVGIAITAIARRLVGSAVVATAGLTTSGASLIVVALADSQPSTALSFVLCGIGMTCAFTSASVMIQQRVRSEYRGRVMAVWSMAFLGTRPISSALNGVVADQVSLDAALVVVAALVGIAAIVSRPGRIDPDRTR